MASINSINNTSNPLASTAVTIDPGASGDSYVQFDINTTGEFRIGVDDNDSDKFKISQGSALGTNDTFVMTADGERTLPLQPAFLAYLASDDNNVTGTGTNYTLGTNTALTEVFDQNSDFVTSGTFTAPVTGRYYFYYWIKFHEITSGNSMNTQIVTSNRSYLSLQTDPSVISNNSSELALEFGVFADMDASDTTTFTIVVDGEASDLIDLTGGATVATAVAGYLAC